ncbi:MAG: hypothetical protein ACLP7P_12025 [Rhodomicrobium sp.]
MLRTAAIAVFLAAPALAPLANAAPSDDQCKAMWTKADANKNGVLEGDEAGKFLDAIDKSGKIYDANSDRKLDQTEFMKACKDGIFDSIK